MKTLNALPKITAILFFIIAIASCDEDFNTIGVDIIGDDDLLTQSYVSNNIISYSRILDPVQTNIEPVHKLGIYNDHVFGKSTTNYITQLLMVETDPIFGDTLGQSINFESAILYIPFFSESSVEGEGDDEETVYTLDSVYGNSPIKISMFESNFFLRDRDPDSNFQDPQLYYSNQGPEFEGFLGELLIEIEDFVPSDEGFIITNTEIDDDGEETIDTTYVAPGIRVELPLEFFQEKIFNKEGEQVLASNNNFKEFFRGLYFKVESLSEEGSMFIFNPENASISLNYDFERTEEDSEGNMVTETIDESYILEFGGVNLNTYINEIPQNIISEIENPDIINGEENLYLRGGEGILTVINIFSGVDEDDNGVSDELDSLRIREPLINEANLKFYVDQDKIDGGSTEPERIIIYDLKNYTVLADYFIDTTSGNVAVDAITIHLGRLERGSDDLGDYYNIRLTNHVSNLINKDSTNIPLGLIATNNVLLSGFQYIDSITNPPVGELPRIRKIPRSSVISPEGTVLFGNNTSNVDKRLKLQIQFLDPN